MNMAGRALRALVSAPIVADQRYISPALGPRCRYAPTCSTYALEAVEVHGALKGGLLAVWRVLRCHPFHREKSFIYEPVPPKGRWRKPVT